MQFKGTSYLHTSVSFLPITKHFIYELSLLLSALHTDCSSEEVRKSNTAIRLLTCIWADVNGISTTLVEEFCHSP
jgi:hypothetical protein